MAAAASTVTNRVRLTVRRDLRSVRKLLRRVRRSVQLADLFLFGRRNPARTLDYLDRRECDRSPLEIPIYVTPAAFDGRHVESLDDSESEILAITRDVSLRGIGFRHDEPFEGDYAVVTFDLMDGDAVSLLLEVRWSNIEIGYSSMSGGRFLGISEIPDL